MSFWRLFQYAVSNFNVSNPYYDWNQVVGTEATRGLENILAPGRRPLGNGRYGHADLAGLLFETTSSIIPEGQLYEGLVHMSKSGSWEAHPLGDNGWAWTTNEGYFAICGRCTYLR